MAEQTESLDAADLELYLPAIKEWQDAQKAFERARRDVQEKGRLALGASGAVAYLFRRMQPKYGLVEGDDIDSNGVILRRANDAE